MRFQNRPVGRCLPVELAGHVVDGVALEAHHLVRGLEFAGLGVDDRGVALRRFSRFPSLPHEPPGDDAQDGISRDGDEEFHASTIGARTRF